MSGFSLERPIVMHSLIISFIFSAIFVTAITIIGEQVPPVKDWLKETHGHHWVGKGIWTLVLFAVVGFISYLSLKIKHNPVSAKLIYWAGYTAIAAAVVMTLFFVDHYLATH